MWIGFIETRYNAQELAKKIIREDVKSKLIENFKSNFYDQLYLMED